MNYTNFRIISIIILILFNGCKEADNYLSNPIVEIKNEELSIELIYNYNTDIEINENILLENKKILNEKEIFPFELIDTLYTKNFKIELEYYSVENNADSTWSKTIFDIRFGKIVNNEFNHWIPFKISSIGLGRNTDLNTHVRPIFLFTLDSIEKFEMQIPVTLSLLGKNSYSNEYYSKDRTVSTSNGIVTSELIFLNWISSNGELRMDFVKHENTIIMNPVNKVLNLPELIELDLTDRIVKEIFSTNKILMRRINIIKYST